MEKNPTLHATVPKAVPQKREVWDAETIFLALDICDDAHLKLAINTSFACSMWIGEILGLTWDCVDISPKSIAAGTASIMIEKELQRVNKTAMKSLKQKTSSSLPAELEAQHEHARSEKAQDRIEHSQGFYSGDRCPPA